MVSDTERRAQPIIECRAGFFLVVAGRGRPESKRRRTGPDGTGESRRGPRFKQGLGQAGGAGQG